MTSSDTDRAVPWRESLLLRGPRALGVLAEFTGLHLEELLQVCVDAPAPEINLGFPPRDLEDLHHAVAFIFFPGGEVEHPDIRTPRWLRRRRRRQYGTAWTSRRDRHSPEPRRIVHRDLTDPETLITEVLFTVAGWQWNVVGQPVRQYLLAEAEALATAARQLVQAPATSWWRDPLDRDAQVILGSPEQPPDPHALLSHPAHDPDGTFWWVPPIGLASSTWVGPRLPAVQLCDLEAIYHLPRPIGCWRFPVRADALVYEVHTPADWLALCERYAPGAATARPAPQPRPAARARCLRAVSPLARPDLPELNGDTARKQ